MVDLLARQARVQENGFAYQVIGVRPRPRWRVQGVSNNRGIHPDYRFDPGLFSLQPQQGADIRPVGQGQVADFRPQGLAILHALQADGRAFIFTEHMQDGRQQVIARFGQCIQGRAIARIRQVLMLLLDQPPVMARFGCTDTVEHRSVQRLATHFNRHLPRPARQSLQQMQHEFFTVRGGRGLQVQPFVGAGQAHFPRGVGHLFCQSRRYIAVVQVLGLFMRRGLVQQMADNTQRQFSRITLDQLHVRI